MPAKPSLWLFVLLTCTAIGPGCQDRYERLPEATSREREALSGRYKSLIDEAKGLQGGDPLALLHHFSHAALTRTQPADFKAKAGKFIEQAASGKLDGVTIRGARSPGKVRLLLVDTDDGKGVIPFVQSSDGWKFDDIDLAFGHFRDEVNLDGKMPASPPSILAALSVLQDPQASDTDKVDAAIGLAAAKDKKTAEKFAGRQKSAWPKAALLYAVWKSGSPCEPFAAAFPIEAELQSELYDADTQSFRTLLKGLVDCAASSNKLQPTIQVYRGCYVVEGGPRSEYVDPVVDLANAKPGLVLRAAVTLKYPYDRDPVANIVVGALHGEQKSEFYNYLHNKAVKRRGRFGKVAKLWVEKMAERDRLEPPGSENQEGQPE